VRKGGESFPIPDYKRLQTGLGLPTN